MLTEIVNYMQLDVADDNLIFVTKDVISDINFIFNELLLNYIKKDYTVILLNLCQSANHYNGLVLKSGVNIRKLINSEKFIVVDGLSEIEKITNDTSIETGRRKVFETLFVNLKDDCVKQLYYYIRDIAQKLNDMSKPFVLLIDDIGTLLNLGLNVKSIALFVQYCRSLCMNNEHIKSTLLIGSTHENMDPENDRMIRYLNHLADLKIEVGGLKTGYSKDVHGKITLHIKKKSEDISTQKLLFKVTEQGAKLMK